MIRLLLRDDFMDFSDLGPLLPESMQTIRSVLSIHKIIADRLKSLRQLINLLVFISLCRYQPVIVVSEITVLVLILTPC